MQTELRVLSVRQPWASLIAAGRPIEIRSWVTHYRGPVLIVSGGKAWRGKHDHALGPLGVAICVVDIVGCRPLVESDFASSKLNRETFDELLRAGHFALELARPRAVAPARVIGRLGLYRADATLRRVAGFP